MACYFPLKGWKARHADPVTGKRAVVFKIREGYVDLPVKVPCGQCIGCRLERSRQWAIRCMHEASLYPENCFITLTYSDEYLPVNGSLDRKAFPLFMKRLRKHESPRRIRFYHCGEYGSYSARPHYHAILFGYDLSDKTYLSVRGGHPVFVSETLRQLWPYGLHEVGSVTFESAAYVARYCLKKVTGSDEAKKAAYERVDPETGEVVRLESEYSTMSRRPGIGKPWLEKFGCEVYPADGVVVRGRLVKPPRFYDTQWELGSPEEMEAVRRVRRARRNRADETEERLDHRREVAEARLNLNARKLV